MLAYIGDAVYEVMIRAKVVNKGSIQINGHDVRGLQPQRRLREMFGMVLRIPGCSPERSWKISGMAGWMRTDEEVIAAARQLNIHKFIMQQTGRFIRWF